MDTVTGEHLHIGLILSLEAFLEEPIQISHGDMLFLGKLAKEIVIRGEQTVLFVVEFLLNHGGG